MRNLPYSVRHFWPAATAAWMALLAGAPRPALAQKAYVTLEAGYGVAQAHWGTFEQFLSSYHQVQGSDVASAASLGTVQPWSIRACAFGMVTLGYDQVRANLRTSLKSGGERHFDLRHNLLTLGVEPSFQREHFFVGVVGGLGFGSLRVDTPFKYADGTLSYGAETEINGVYRATSLVPYFGGKLGVSFKHVALTLRAEKFVAGNITADGSLSDQTVYNIPTDYARYLKQGALLYGPDEIVLSDLSTLRFQVQLGYMIAPIKDE